MTNPGGLQQYLSANPILLQQYLTSSPEALQQYLSSSPEVLQQYQASSIAAQQAYLQANAAGIGAYLISNSTALSQFLGSDTKADTAYLSGSGTGLEAYLTSNPGDLQQYIANGNPTVLQGYLSANPTVIQQYLASNATVLQQFIASNPASLQQYLTGNSTVLQQFLISNPTSLQQYLTSNPTALIQFLSSDPTQLQQFLTQNPAVLQTFLGTDAQALQQTLNAAILDLFRLNVTLPGSGNEASGGLLSTFNIGSGGEFTESITTAQLALLNQAVASGTSLAGYAVNVTAEGGDNTLVGGLLANFTAKGGGDNNFVIEDPSQLGLASGTSIPAAAAAMGGTFTGGGSSDTVYFVGGSSVNPFGNVTLTEPAGASNETLDFSSFTAGGVDINLNTTGTAQVVNATADLSVTLPAGGAFTNVIGSPGNDTIIGNGTGDILQGGAAANPNPNALPAVPPPPLPVQWVALNFTAFTPTPLGPGETFHNATGDYSAAEQEQVLQGLENIYSQYSSSIEFSIDPAEITQLEGPDAPLASIDLTSADVTTLAGLVNTTFADSVYDDGSGNYVSVYYNDTPIFNGQAAPGGFSNEVDFGNLNQKTTVQLDVNGFLGDGPGLVPDSTADSSNGLSDFVNMSITISAHEVGHTLGLEHMDALGPIGFGIANPPGAASYFPDYAGPVGAFTTQGDVIASPASVGSTLANAADGLAQLGARDAITLAFITDGTTVASDATDPSNTSWAGMPMPTVLAAPLQTDTVQLEQDPDLPGVGAVPEAEGDVDLQNDNVAGVATTVTAQPVSLYDLNVPNPITSGFDAGMTFDVSAVDIDGYIGGAQPVLDASGNPVTDPKTGNAYTVSVPNYYTFTGHAGQLMSFQAMSTSITSIKDPVDTVLTIYGPNGQALAYNDDQFEPSDSSIFDFTLPASGTYTVEVSAFHSTDPSFNDPSAQNYLPAAYYNAQHGAYELFMYTFSAYNAHAGSDSIQYTTGSVVVSSTPQVTTSTGVVPGTPYGALIVFGTGANLLVGAGESSSEGGSSFALQPTSTVTLTAPGGTYTGSPIAATALVGTQSIAPSTSLDGVAPTLTYYVVSGDSFTELGTTAPTNVGSYIVVASFPGDANYAPSSATASFTITPATLTITATGGSKVYDGTTTDSAAPTFQVAGEPVDTLYGSDTITGLTEAFTSKDVLGADLSTLVVTGYVINDDDDGANYRVTLLSALGTITPAALTISATSQTKVYDGTAASTAAPTDSGLFTTGGDTITGLSQAFASKNVLGASGSTLQVTGYAVNDGDGGKDYTVTLHTASGTITPAALSITASGQTKVYDGTTVSAAAPSYSGLITVGGDTITGLTQAFASKNVLGTNGSTLQVTGYTVNDGDGGNDYTVSLHTAGGTITPVALSITATGQTKVYDGTTTSTATPTYSGLITVGGDTLTGLTQAFASKNVLGTGGSTLQVTGYTVNDGDGGHDYTVTLHTASGTITPAALTITATSQTKVYDGTTTSTATPTYSGLITAGGDTVSGLSQAFTSKDVLGTAGSTLQVTGYTINDGDGGNDYTVTLHTASGTITPAALSVSATSQTKVYDGTTASTAAPTYSGLITIGGDTITGLSQAFASKNVLGTNGSTLQVTGYTINDGNGGADYTVTLQTATGTITPAAAEHLGDG